MKVFVTTAVLLVILVGVNAVPLNEVRGQTRVVMTKFYYGIYRAIIAFWYIVYIVIVHDKCMRSICTIRSVAWLLTCFHPTTISAIMSRVSLQSPTCKKLKSSWRRQERSMRFRRANTRGRPGVLLMTQVRCELWSVSSGNTVQPQLQV